MSQDFPLLDRPVPAGFPAPIDERSSGRIDLNAHLIKQADATFLVRVEGDSMTGFGIHDGDTLIVDRSIEAKDGHIVLAVIGEEFTLKQLQRKGSSYILRAGNPGYRDRIVKFGEEFSVWGVARWSLHPLIGTAVS
jgi:DNA polymerase V